MQSVKTSVLITSMEGRAHFLVEALRSLATQTMPPDEVVLVLEGEDPSWPYLLQRFASLNLRVFRRPAVSGRPGPGKNLALREARGEYLVLLDDDDLAFPERIERQVGFLESHPEVDFVASPMEYRGGGKDGTVWPDPREAGFLTLERLLQGNRILYSSVTIRRRALSGFPGFPEDRRVGEDYEAWLSLLASGKRGYLLQEVSGIRRIHGTNVSTPGGPELEERSIQMALRYLPFCANPGEGKRMLGKRWRALARRYRGERRRKDAARAFHRAFCFTRSPGDALRWMWMELLACLRP